MFKSTELIGSGLYGTVYGTADSRFAIKEIDTCKNPTFLNWAVEISILKHMSGFSNNFPVFIGSELDRDKKCRICMHRYTPLGTLDVTTIDSQVRDMIIYDVGAGLTFLHHFGLIHTDIKKHNVLLDMDDDRLVHAILCDFGLAQATSYMKLRRSRDVQIIYKKKIGVTPPPSPAAKYDTYRAYPSCARPPEIMKSGCINTRSDVWAFGCFILSMHDHVDGIDLEKWQGKENQGKVDSLVDQVILDDNTRDICKKILQLDAASRPTMDKLVGTVSHAEDDPQDITLQIYETYGENSPYYILTSFILKLLKSQHSDHIKKMICGWNEQSTISKDAVLMSINLILRYAKYCKDTSCMNNSIYLEIMICLNLALQLFHPKIIINIDDIYCYVDSDKSDYPTRVYNLLQCLDFNLFLFI
jgi:serine/threonine protein kinase